MNIIKSFITEYGLHIIATALIGILSYLGIQIKSIIHNYSKQIIAKEEAEIVYHGIEELYCNQKESKKIELMIINLKQILNEKNITITNLELQMLIYSTINKKKEHKNGSDVS